METNIRSKKTAAKNISAKTKPVEADPFATTVYETPVKTRVAGKTAVAARIAAAEFKPVKKTLRKAAKMVVSDPFAEVAVTSSPAKKRTAKKSATGKLKTKPTKKTATLDATTEIAALEPKVELSLTFKALADVTLPALQRENRARLQMQTPTRLYFYWSVKENPWALLKNVFGDDLGSYSLVLKLIDNTHGFEEIHQTEAEGNYWFDVEPDASYRAEIGFYAPNRPYFRILHSNTVATPRRSPSPRAATDADWTVSANKFAEVLDVAGFSRDAFDVAMAGDDHAAAVDVSQAAFSSFLGDREVNLDGISAEDIRYALLALASGVTLEDLRFRVSPALFSILQASADKLDAGKAMSTLKEHFDIDESEFTEEQLGPAVFGSSLVNFPRTRTRSVSAKSSTLYSPVSSYSIGR
ncbi:MAG: DUF4912 domain-containing protein [Pyrinomonadaceae bacterium]